MTCAVFRAFHFRIQFIISALLRLLKDYQYFEYKGNFFNINTCIKTKQTENQLYFLLSFLVQMKKL